MYVCGIIIFNYIIADAIISGFFSGKEEDA